MSLSFELPKWHDLHAHFRQDSLLAPLIKTHLDMGCAGILAMPNTAPPVGKVLERDDGDYWSIEHYLEQVKQAGGEAFENIIVPLYLTKDTTPEMIAAGVKAGILKACKYYPPFGTTNAGYGQPLDHFMSNGVFEAMAANNIVLCIHGEEHGLPSERYFSRQENAEEIFYRERMPELTENFENLKIVCEHITTKVAADFVNQAGANVAASVTPQHLIYTIGDLVKGLYYHLYCLPLVKFEEDRAALREAVTDKDNTKFFAGTDSAPHTEKCTPCGCAAGCFTGGVAPQLYAQGFELAGVDLLSEGGQAVFKKFLCSNGQEFYGLPASDETFTLIKKDSAVEITQTPAGSVVPLPVGMNPDHEKTGTTLPWKIV